jgi:hypothetical protein
VSHRYYLIDAAQAYNAMQKNALKAMPEDISKFRFSLYNSANLNENQSLLIHVLRWIRDHNYRRLGDCVYEEVMHVYEDRIVSTRAWRVCMEKFENLVRDATPRATMFEQWCNLTKKSGSMEFVVRYLKDAREDEFPTLKPDRRVFAFRNGIFVAGVDESTRTEYLRDHPDEHDFQILTIENCFYTWDTAPADLIACNFIDMDFDISVFSVSEDCFKVETPHFDSILTYQGFDDPEYGENLEVMRWIYALGIGKLLYEVRDRENWECLLFLKGIAGSGKSTISQIISALYPKSKVGAISNNIEKIFGLGALFEKWVWIAKEVKNNFGVDQGDFQSMITGEEVSIAIKHGTAKSIAWTVPGLVCGNETANWVDAAGSIGRRLVVADFGRAVKSSDVDPDLWRKIKSELPRILYKANAMYLTFAKKYHSTQIWKALPQYFRDQRTSMQSTINPLVAFLTGECADVVLNEDEYVPLSEFQKTYNRFCISRNNGHIKFTVDHYRDVFQQYRLDVTKCKNAITWRGKEYRDIKIIYGVGLKNADI